MSKQRLGLDEVMNSKMDDEAERGPVTYRSRRLSMQVSGEDYKRLRQYALDYDMTHQQVLEKALGDLLNTRR